jgi:hypothetical protein
LATIPQHNWFNKLLGYDFTIEYKLGRTNVVIDALSRCDTPEALLHGISSPTFDLLEDIKQAVEVDEDLLGLRDQIVVGTLAVSWTVVDGLVLYQNHIYIPANFPFLSTILVVVHDDNHDGIQRTLHRLHRDFHVPSAKKIVQDYVRVCVVCQEKQDGAHAAWRPPSVPSSSLGSLAAHQHGFRRRAAQGCRQISDFDCG